MKFYSAARPANSGVRRATTIVTLVSVTIVISALVQGRFLGDAAVLFALLAIFNLFVLADSERELQVLLQPSVVIINYLYASLLVGALAFHWDLIVLPAMIDDVRHWDSPLVPRVFLVSVLGVVILIGNFRATVIRMRRPMSGAAKVYALSVLAVAVSATLVWAEFPFAGEVGAVFAASIAFHANRWAVVRRWLLLGPLIAVLAVLFSDSKRNAVFLLYPVLVLEVAAMPVKTLRLKQVLRVGLLGAATLLLIIVATAWRVREIVGIETISELPSAALMYVRQEQFAAYFMLNIEATYTYFHVMNAFDYAASGLIPVLFGATYLKALVIGIPSEILAWSPSSAVHEYTSAYDPLFRAAGGSWAITMLGEGYLNFRIVGSVFAGFILVLADSVYRWMLRTGFIRSWACAIVAFYFPVACLLFARGSGIDLALVNVMVVALAASVLSPVFSSPIEPIRG